MSPINLDVPMPAAPPVRMRRRVAALCEATLLRPGARRLCRLFGGRGGAAILMYHSVPGEDVRPWIDPRNTTHPDEFARQMQFLATQRSVVPLAEVVAALESGRSLAPGTVALTFDDGYRDQALVAAPILAALGLPATFFLATGAIDRGAPQWVDELYAIYRTRTASALDLGALGPSFDLAEPQAASASHALVAGRLLVADEDGRQALFARLRQQLRPAAAPPRCTLDWREVRELAACPGFVIGVHTRAHLALPKHDRARVAEDLARFRAAVVTGPPSLVGRRADRFALPRIGAPRDTRLLQFCTSGANPRLVRRLLQP
jgi:peptidoglycan/xylan/chitin deacetylase (PgdA/CDA1 family)